MRIIEPEWAKDSVIKYDSGGWFEIDKSKIPEEVTLTQDEFNNPFRKFNRDNPYADINKKRYNFNQIISDMRSWTPNEQLLAAIKRLKGFDYSKNKNKPSGWSIFNQLFDLTGLNKYFGYDSKVDDYWGPSTAARFHLIQALTLKDPNNARLATGAQLSTKDNTSELRQPANNNDTHDLSQLRSPILDWTNNNHKYKTGKWTDWIPHTFTLGSNLLTGISNLKNEKQIRFPKMTAPYIYGKLEDNYYGQLRYKQAAAETRAIGEEKASLINDLSAANLIRLGYEEKANQLEDKGIELGVLAEKESLNRLDKIGQFNEVQATKADNYNRQSDIAAWNNILQANSKWNELKNTALNDFVTNMYTDYGNWLKGEKQNKYYHDALLLNLATEEKIQALMKQFQDKSSDYSKSKAYQDWRTQYIGDKLKRVPRNSDGTINEAGLIELFKKDTTSPYQAAYTKEMEDLASSLYESINRLRIQSKLYNIENFPYIINNLIDRSGLYKSGGRVARLTDYAKLNLRELDSTRKLLMKTVLKNAEMLDKSLSRISEQLLLMMRALFK